MNSDNCTIYICLFVIFVLNASFVTWIWFCGRILSLKQLAMNDSRTMMTKRNAVNLKALFMKSWCNVLHLTPGQRLFFERPSNVNEWRGDSLIWVSSDLDYWYWLGWYRRTWARRLCLTGTVIVLLFKVIQCPVICPSQWPNFGSLNTVSSMRELSSIWQILVFWNISAAGLHLRMIVFKIRIIFPKSEILRHSKTDSIAWG